MSNFITVVSRKPQNHALVPAFRRALHAAGNLHGASPTAVYESEHACVASFPRENGTGGVITVDPLTQSWLLTLGSPFHDAGLVGAGLLARARAVGAERFARELDGPFVVLVGDDQAGEVSLTTDIAGLRHVYATEDAEHDLVLLSGSSALLAVLGDAEPDALGSQEFLRTAILFEGRTLFRSVRRLRAASVYRFGGAAGKERRACYWHISEVKADARTARDSADALLDSLSATVRKIGSPNRRVVTDLTGGYDSRALFAGCLSSGVPFSTAVTGPADSDDVLLSRMIARRSRVPHSYLPQEPSSGYDDIRSATLLTDGEFDSVEYSSIAAIHRRLLPAHDVSLNGSAGEIGRGRWWMFLLPRVGRHGKWDSSRLVRTRFSDASNEPSLFPEASRLNIYEHVAGIIDRVNVGLEGARNTLQVDNWYLEVMGAWHGRIASSTDRLWPSLTPFLFRRVLETMLSASVKTRWRSYLVRRMLADHHPDLAKICTANGNPPMPLTPLTAFRFWKLPYRYAARIGAKGLRTLGIAAAARSSYGERKTSRTELWQDERVRALLEPGTMTSAAFLDERSLASFLGRSRGALSFGFDAEWCRLLTIETIFEEVHRARRNLAALEPVQTGYCVETRE